MGGVQGRRATGALAVVVALLAACGPNEQMPPVRPLVASPSPIAAAPPPERIPGVEAARLATTTPLATSPVMSSAGAVLAPPPTPRRRPVPPDRACAGFADPGFTARCGIARNPGGDLLWLLQTGSGGRGFRMELLRPLEAEAEAGAEAGVLLEANDDAGARFDSVRVAVADVSGDGGEEISVAFYRTGVGQILALDLVEAPGTVVLHRDYVQGSARASAGQLEAWEAVKDPSSGTTLLGHETIQRRDGVWRRTSLVTTATTAVFGQDFADPFVLRAGDRYVGYSTNRGPWNVPVIASRDRRDWQPLGDALPQLPTWSVRGRVWAPSVLARPAPAPNPVTNYVLYYTTRHEASGLQCISAASGTSPEGPFADRSTAPLVCQFEDGGSIDPSPFVDRDGNAYLLWKSEDRGRTIPARIWSQPLSADGLSLTGAPVPILAQDQGWEAPTLEGPAMVGNGDRLYLFYSAGTWQNSTYAVGYAVCSSPAGPCAKAGDRPLLSTHAGVSGPGGQEIVQDTGGRRWLAYHAWVPADGGYPGGRRLLHLSPLRFDERAPSVDGAPAPSVVEEGAGAASAD